MFASDARRFLELDAVVLAVSLDDLETLERFSEEVGADYPMGSDRVGREAVTAYRVPVSGSGYAQRSVFVIDADNTIRWVSYRYRIRDDYASVLAALEEIRR
jgi:peroxiredoxin